LFYGIVILDKLHFKRGLAVPIFLKLARS